MTVKTQGLACSECSAPFDKFRPRGLCSKCYERHRRSGDVPWAAELMVSRIARRNVRQQNAAKRQDEEKPLCIRCPREATYGRQFCSRQCANAHVDEAALAALERMRVARNVWDMRCMMCGWNREATAIEVEQAKRFVIPHCPHGHGQLLFERNDVGSVSSIGADTPLRPRTSQRAETDARVIVLPVNEPRLS